MDLDFGVVFKCLSVDNVVAVFAAMLLEQKVVLASKRSTLTTAVAETLRILLYPLDWQLSYCPILPLQMSAFLESFTGFILGIGLPADATRGTAADAVSLLDNCEEDVIVVRLDDDAVWGTAAAEALSAVPAKPLATLARRLQTECARAGISQHPPASLLDGLDSPFTFKHYDDDAHGELDSSEIRAAFLECTTQLLLPLTVDCIKVPNTDPDVQEAVFGIASLVNMDAFLSPIGATPDMVQFRARLAETQSFAWLVQRCVCF